MSDKSRPVSSTFFAILALAASTSAQLDQPARLDDFRCGPSFGNAQCLTRTCEDGACLGGPTCCTLSGECTATADCYQSDIFFVIADLNGSIDASSTYHSCFSDSDCPSSSVHCCHSISGRCAWNLNGVCQTPQAYAGAWSQWNSLPTWASVVANEPGPTISGTGEFLTHQIAPERNVRPDFRCGPFFQNAECLTGSGNETTCCSEFGHCFISESSQCELPTTFYDLESACTSDSECSGSFSCCDRDTMRCAFGSVCSSIPAAPELGVASNKPNTSGVSAIDPIVVLSLFVFLFASYHL